MVWNLIDTPDDMYVFKELDGTTVFEYCSIFEDENGNKCYVPDSFYQEFIDTHNVLM